MRKKVLSVKDFFDANAESLVLQHINDHIEGPLPITVTDIHRPGLALTGFMQTFLNERIQILGETEILFLNTREPAERKLNVENLFAVPLVCIIVTRDLAAPRELVDACNRHGVPLLRTSMATTPFIHELTKFLDDYFAPTEVVHGTMVDVYGVGLLFTGKSGIGKSEIALDLVMRGHRLVADDIVDVKRKTPESVFGAGSEIIKHHMEVRGLGIINIKDLFGVASIRERKKIEIVLELVEWDPTVEYDRLGVEERKFRILDVEIPMLIVPVRPGRNMTTIVEVAARNHLLKLQGHHSAREFQERLNRAIALAPGSRVGEMDVE
jgi:HPr kinase/phosphorylase